MPDSHSPQSGPTTGPQSAPAAAASVSWHHQAPDAVLQTLGSNATTGLAADEAARRLQQHGPNALQEQQRRPAWRMLLDQFHDFMILVLLAAAVLAGFSGDLPGLLTIVAILLLNALIGFSQERRAAQAMQALRQLAAPQAQVRRDDRQQLLPASALVPGDLVLLEAGNLVPADLRLLHSAGLQLNEAALTGEALPVDKDATLTLPAATPLGDRRNLAFKGTLVSHGRGLGVVTATGMQTELGRIATLLETAEDTQTPLQGRLTVFSKRLALVILGICALIFGAGLLRGEPMLPMLLTALSLAVAAIPEALPAVVTIALALGAHRLARQQALMRRLPSVETLGSVSWICTDKTGTLTENRMQVEQVWLGEHPLPAQPMPDKADTLFKAMLLCNDAVPQDGGIVGEATEAALLAAALDSGLDRMRLQQQLPRSSELPFAAERMRMTTLHQDRDSLLAFTKGAPEAVIALCQDWWEPAGKAAWDPARVSAAAAALAEQGMRVLAFAARRHTCLPPPADTEKALQFIGLVGLMDPPRPEAAAAIASCQSAGITPVMITGDHPGTARAIATRLGLAPAATRLLTGSELQALDDAALADCVQDVRIFARMDPAQKIRIVKALQAKGAFVAMTGDGVNDAPALRQADIGVAMGRSGTDVAREASDLVLLDDNFASIVAAIRGGRHIYDNIRRFIRYILTTNLAEVLLILLAPLLGLPLPLLPIQILWINLVTDGLPGLALSLEPPERNLMQRPPRLAAETLFARGLWLQVLWTGVLMAALVLGLQAWGVGTGNPHWQSLVFTALTFTQLGNVLVLRSDHDSLWRLGLGSNPLLLFSVLLTVGLQLALLYLPSLNGIFGTQPLKAGELLLCAGVALLVMLAVEAEKALIRHGRLYRSGPADTAGGPAGAQSRTMSAPEQDPGP